MPRSVATFELSLFAYVRRGSLPVSSALTSRCKQYPSCLVADSQRVLLLRSRAPGCSVCDFCFVTLRDSFVVPARVAFCSGSCVSFSVFFVVTVRVFFCPRLFWCLFVSFFDYLCTVSRCLMPRFVASLVPVCGVFFVLFRRFTVPFFFLVAYIFSCSCSQVKVNGGNRGVYLRQLEHVSKKTQWSITVEPVLHEDEHNDKRVSGCRHRRLVTRRRNTRGAHP